MKLAALFLLTLFFSVPARAQAPLECTLFNFSPAQRSLQITCRVFLQPQPVGAAVRKLAVQFTDQFAGVGYLSDRIRALKFKDHQGAPLLPEMRGDGLYVVTTAGGELTINYAVQLARAFDPAQHALVSSLGPTAAVLLLSDLLPRVCANESTCTARLAAKVKVETPDGWQAATVEPQIGDHYQINDCGQAVLFLARLRERISQVGAMKIKTALAGAWDFTDAASFALTEAIARKQAEMIGGHEAGDFLVIIAPFPQPLTGLRSSGVTIGHTAILLLNPDGDAARTQLHLQKHLAHELFHFYLPNAFAIGENFDWFWEGSARYLALITLVELRAITFRQYLDALAEEYAAYAFNPLRARVSLVAASPEKFADAASYELVYRKGMLVAALYDLELRWQSGGKSSLADVISALYRRHAHTGHPIGNQAVLMELARFSQAANFLRDDVEGTKEIELSKRLKNYGLVIEQPPRAQARIVAAQKLSTKQQALLAHFGG